MKNLTALCLIILTISSSELYGQSFECNSNLYQVVDGNHLKVLNPATGNYETVGISSTRYNGAGYNSEDGYIYGIGSGTTLVKVDNTGEATDLGAISDFSALSYSGDFDLQGNWYSFKKSSGLWIMNKIDVSVLPPVAEEFEVTKIDGVVNPSSTADMSFNTISNKFYGMTGGVIIEFDPFNKTVKGLADYSDIADNEGYGAAWSDQTGKTYFFNNNTGNIYRAEFNMDGDVLSFAFISTSSPNGSNDGMSCPMAQAPVFPEICDNGLDDDGDGLTDCEDPDCTASESCGISGVMYSSTFVCIESIGTYHAFFTNNSSFTNTIEVTETLPQGFVFLQDTLEFDAGGFSDFVNQPQEGAEGTINWGSITLEGKETVRISYDVTLNETSENGSQQNEIRLVLGNERTNFYPTMLSAEVLVGECPTANTFDCEPAFYQVYKKKGKNQPNVFGKLNPITGDYDAIAMASDYANGLGYDINTGLVYGASGNRFIQMDEDGLVLDQGISFDKKVYRGDINNNSEWFGAIGGDLIKIDVSNTPNIVDKYIGQALPGWDMSFNNDGHFYAIHNQSLYQFNTNTNTKVTLGVISGFNIPENGGYGAQWAGSDGFLYASHNLTGKILRVNVTTREARVVAYSTDGLSKNDGFSCPSTIPIVFEFDYGDNSRLPSSRILAYKQDVNSDDVPDFSTFWLGSTVNFDEYDLSNNEATGDLDDGFTLSTEISGGKLSAVIGLNTNMDGTGHYLLGFDWNDNGEFDQVLSDSAYLTTANTVLKEINVPTDFEDGSINVRIIVSEKSLNVTDISGDILDMGEVEDYRYLITTPCVNCDVTTGANGGLESNGALANAIAKRNYSRVKNNENRHLRKNQLKFDQKYQMSRFVGEHNMANYFPESGSTGKEEATISSPDDLIQITNAKEVFAIDYYLDNKRIAASLLMSTENEVYNHSKNVCDRLNGKSIQDVQLINIHGVSVIFAQIRNEDGAIEYSSWFSAKSIENSYEVFSLWNVDSYTPGQYLNFQVWSSSPKEIFHILEYVFDQLESEKVLKSNQSIQQLPKVIVKSGYYVNGELRLTLINKNKSTSVAIEANIRRTEQSLMKNELFQVNLNGAHEQEVTIETGLLFDAGISLKLDNATAYDALYLADGAWGADYNATNSNINQFNILESEKSDQEDVYSVERSFEITGTSNDVVNVFRNIKTGEKSLSLDTYSTISFDIKNDQPIEVTLVEKGLSNWGNRLKLQLPINTNKKTAVLKLTDFIGIQENEKLNVQTIVFSYINQSGVNESFEFSVDRIQFGNAIILSNEESVYDEIGFVLYPNPAANYVKIKSNYAGLVKIVDMTGHVLIEVKTSNSDDEIEIPLELNIGLYAVILISSERTFTKLMQVK